MNTSLKFVFALALAVLTLSLSPKVQASAADESDDEVGYEDIVKDLAKEQRRTTINTSRTQVQTENSQSSLDDVLIHGGVGITQMFGTVAYGSDRTMYSQQGIQASLGIDLFSENFMAEGSARNFSTADYGATNIALKEFDLKVIYHNHFAPKLGLRVSTGLAARYMHIAQNGQENDYTTPASIFSGGLDLLVAKSLTIGAELGARTALVSDTIDKNSFDVTVHLDANF